MARDDLENRSVEFSRRQLLGAAGVGLLATALVPRGLLSAQSAGASTGSIGGTLNWLGWSGEDAKAETSSWLSKNGVTLNRSYMTGQSDILNALEVSKPLDLVNPFNGYISVLHDAGLIQPIDLSKVPNFSGLFPVLKNASWLKSRDGKVLAVPDIWGDGPYIANPKNLPTKVPKSILGLANAIWHKKIVWLDDPYTTIYGFATALKFKTPNMLTRSQLDRVVAAAKPVMKNVVSIASGFSDAADLLIRGEASVSPIGWEAMLLQGQKAKTTLVKGYFADFGVAYCDNYAIPTKSANPDTAHAYINEVISAKVNAALAGALVSGTVTKPGYSDLTSANKRLYNYAIVDSPRPPVPIVNSTPPQTSKNGIMGNSDWVNAWDGLKAL